MPRLIFVLVALFLCRVLPAATNAQPPAQQTLRLSLVRAMQMAVAHNLQAAISALDIAKSKQDLKKQGAAYSFSPYIYTGYSKNRSSSSSWSAEVEAGISKQFRSGTGLSLGLSSKLLGEQEAAYGSDPAYDTGLTITLSQALLQKFGTAYHSYGLESARLSLTNALVAYQEQIAKLVRDTELAYWKLFHAQRRLDISRLSLKLARQLLEINKLRVKLGLQSRADLIEASSVVATREVEVLTARNDQANARDELISILNLNAETNRVNDIQLITKPGTTNQQFSFAAYIGRALQGNLEYRMALTTARQYGLDVGYYSNLALPELDLDVSLGMSGTRDNYPASFPEMASGRNYTLSLGLRLTLPWTSTAGHDLEKARLSAKSAALNLQDKRRTLINSVKTAIRNVRSARTRIAAAGKARDLAKEKLDLMVQKLNLKLASNTDVLQAQKEYLESSLNAEQAVMDYHDARARLYYTCGMGPEIYRIRIKRGK